MKKYEIGKNPTKPFIIDRKKEKKKEKTARRVYNTTSKHSVYRGRLNTVIIRGTSQYCVIDRTKERRKEGKKEDRQTCLQYI